jgi:hypothetical protein
MKLKKKKKTKKNSMKNKKIYKKRETVRQQQQHKIERIKNELKKNNNIYLMKIFFQY